MLCTTILIHSDLCSTGTHFRHYIWQT